MSTIAVNQITDASGGSTAQINGATPTVYNTMGRNRIINGDMRIDQRNAGASFNTAASAANTYSVDRWKIRGDTEGIMTVQQSSTAPAGFSNSLSITTQTVDSSIGSTQNYTVGQLIEGYTCADFAWGTASAKTVTLSFWVRSSLTGTFGGSFRNNAGDRSYPFSYSISAADTWEQKTITVPGDTTGTWLTTTGIGIRLEFGLGVGSSLSGTAGSWAGANYVSTTGAVSVIGTLNATWYITGVQLEVGSVATEFERRPYGTELALCYRYCQPLTLPYGALGKNRTSSLGLVPFQVTTPMRSSPSFTSTVNPGGLWAYYDGSGPSFSSYNTFVTSGTSDGGFVGGGLLINGSSLNTADPFFFSDSGTTKIGILSAEL